MNDTADTPDTPIKPNEFRKHLKHLDFPLILLVASSMNCLWVFLASFFYAQNTDSLVMLNLAYEDRWLTINAVVAVVAAYVLLCKRYRAFMTMMPKTRMLLTLLLSSAATAAISLGMASLSTQANKALLEKALERAGLSHCTDVYVSYRILDVDGMQTAPSTRRALYNKSCERILFAQSGSGHGFALDAERTIALFQEEETRTQVPRYHVCVPEQNTKGLNGVPVNMDKKFLDTVIIAQECTPSN